MLHGSLLDEHHEFVITERVAAESHQSDDEELSVLTATSLQVIIDGGGTGWGVGDHGVIYISVVWYV